MEHPTCGASAFRYDDRVDACVGRAVSELAWSGPRWGMTGRSIGHPSGMASSEMFRTLPFPYEGGVFPRQLGAVVQRTVLDGVEPAREITHWADGDWTIADGVNDPNVPGASVATHIWHVIDRDPSIEPLASMSPGNVAWRTGPQDGWQIVAHRESE